MTKTKTALEDLTRRVLQLEHKVALLNSIDSACSTEALSVLRIKIAQGIKAGILGGDPQGCIDLLDQELAERAALSLKRHGVALASLPIPGRLPETSNPVPNAAS